jgi:hypothetical protein
LEKSHRKSRPTSIKLQVDDTQSVAVACNQCRKLNRGWARRSREQESSTIIWRAWSHPMNANPSTESRRHVWLVALPYNWTCHRVGNTITLSFRFAFLRAPASQPGTLRFALCTAPAARPALVHHRHVRKFERAGRILMQREGGRGGRPARLSF